MKTYVITLSTVFPKGNSQEGQPTHFNALFRKKKIHTIRANFVLWYERFKNIEAGDACLSVRIWTGKPYRSKQAEIAKLTKDDGIGLQLLKFEADRDGNILNRVKIINSDKFVELKDVAENDGLTMSEWLEWFKNYDLNHYLAVIHFTNFRY